MQVVSQAIGGGGGGGGGLLMMILNAPPTILNYSNTKQIANATHDVVSGRAFRRRKRSCLIRNCVETKASLKGLTYDVKTRLTDVYGQLKSELLNEAAVFEWSDHSRQWLHQLMDYTVFPGKLFRGVSVIDGYISLKQGKDDDLTEDELFLACVLGWCVEWFQAAVLIHDDIMDNSETRRGQPCWYRLPKVGKSIAINDGDLLLQQVPRILKKHFSHTPYYVDLLDLFNEVEYQTFLGQMLDVTTTVEREKDLLKYSMTLYHRIAQYKTSCYTFYLPVACALLLAGEKLENHTNVKQVLFDMGIYFQVVNDYQDCFGDLKKTGKVGTDIQDYKFSWLVLQALELCNEEQKKTLLEHYGKSDANDVAIVKAIYNDIDLQGVFADYHSKNYYKLRRSVETHPCKAVQAVGKRYLDGLDQWL